MGGVAVITDSSTCIPSELAVRYGIRVLPISVYAADLDGDEDGERLSVLEAVEHEELFGASRPFVTEYLSAIEAPGCDAAVVITPAGEFAAMFRNATLATELANRPAVVVDSRTAAAGQALVVLAAAERAAGGGDLEAVVRASEEASRRVELVASLATLEPIRRSGPVPEAVLRASELSGTRSVFRMRDGAVEPLEAIASGDATLEAIAAAFRASAGPGVERSTVFHAGAPRAASRLEELLGGVDFVCGFSPAMQVHTGAGVVGAAWIPRPETP
ncbi:MAG TPA: DegV family protein [Acidimicrobiales bacterium]|nr:DegV family protein [Acidimicrobiales bacterium]